MKSVFFRLLKLAAPYKWGMLLAAFFGFLTIGSSIGLMMTSAYIIAKAALHPTIAALQVGIVGVRFFGISRGIFRYLERIMSHEVTFKLLAQLRVWFYTAIEPLSPIRLQKYKSGDLLSRIISDINTLENFYIRVLAPPIVAVMISILMWILFGLFSWVFAALLFVFMLLAGIGVPLLTRTLSRGIGKKLIDLESELSVLTVEHIQGMPELLLFGQASSHLDQFFELNDRLTSLQRRRAQINALHDSLLNVLMNGAVFTLFWVAVPRVSAGLLDGVYLAVLALGAMAAFEAVLPLPHAAIHMQENLAAAERLFDMTDLQEAMSPSIQSYVPDYFDISFKNVTFTYESDEPPVLNDFNLNIPHGHKFAIVGASGVGKTTIAKVLMRFGEPHAGEILIGGLSQKNMSPQNLAELISYVPQNPYLFGGTIRDNLLLANPTASEHELEAACRHAHIYDFVQKVPDGFDTWIGEHGLRLSGGERQRLALARGLLKESPIYIFDEPTANVDGETGRRILKSLMQKHNQKTIIIISHDTESINQNLVDFDQLIRL